MFGRSAMVTGLVVALALVFSPVLAREGALFVHANTGCPMGLGTCEDATNEIVVYQRAKNGQLTFVERVLTGGQGSGPESVIPGITGEIDPLGSQGALALSADRSWLFAVNAGSNEVSVLKVLDGDDDGGRGRRPGHHLRGHGCHVLDGDDDGGQGRRRGRDDDSSGLPRLVLTDRVDSGGEYPVSVTVHEDLVYVLNAGENSNITGFRLHNGCLTPLDGSTRTLLDADSSSTPPLILSSPGQVLFDPKGDNLVVFVKGGGVFLDLAPSPEPAIHVFPVGRDGLPGDPVTTNFDPGVRAPFSGVFDRKGHLFVAWLVSSGIFPQGGVSSYEIVDGALMPLGEDPVEAGALQLLTCWIATDGKRYVYATNTLTTETGINTITGYRIGVGGHRGRFGVDGSLRLLDADGVTGTVDPSVAPLDVALSDGGRFLYVLNGNPGMDSQTVSIFKINRSNGSLEPMGAIENGLPALSVSGEGMVGY
jgi:6-phosphogluconolactonase